MFCSLFLHFLFVFFFFKQKTAYEIMPSLVGSEMCIRDSIYWKNAGDTGSPPQLTLTKPAGSTVGSFAWPAPEWLITNSLGDYVLSGTVLLPVTVSLPQPPSAQGVNLSGNAQWLVCSAEICVPQQASFTLHLAEGSAAPSLQAGLFAAAREAEPEPSPFTSSLSANGVLTITGPALHLAEGSAAPSLQAGLFAAAREAEPEPSPFTSSLSANGVLTITGPGLNL